MSTKNDLFDAGNEIVDAVSNAISNNDYSNLNNEIRSAVADALKTVGVNNSAQPSYMRRPNNQNPVQSHFQNATPFLQRTTDSIKDYVKMFGGAVGALVCGIVALSGFAAALATAGTAGTAVGMVVAFVFLIGMTFFGFMIRSGLNSKSLKDRYLLYARFIGSKEYYGLEMLARQTGRKLSDVQTDMVKLIQTGVIPQARFDDQETTIILTDNAYRQYQQAEEARKLRELEEAKTVDALDPAQVKEVQALLDEGNSYLRTIHSCNEQIADQDVTEKLYRLEHIMNRIFEQVRKNPMSAKKLHRFIDYYLPTTTKLLYAYIDLDKQPLENSNVAETKKQIEESLDTINDGFEKLLDSLFQEVAWDISSDINVMKTMMQQDGLTENESMQM